MSHFKLNAFLIDLGTVVSLVYSLNVLHPTFGRSRQIFLRWILPNLSSNHFLIFVFLQHSKAGFTLFKIVTSLPFVNKIPYWTACREFWRLLLFQICVLVVFIILKSVNSFLNYILLILSLRHLIVKFIYLILFLFKNLRFVINKVFLDPRRWLNLLRLWNYLISAFIKRSVVELFSIGNSYNTEVIDFLATTQISGDIFHQLLLSFDHELQNFILAILTFKFLFLRSMKVSKTESTWFSWEDWLFAFVGVYGLLLVVNGFN